MSTILVVDDHPINRQFLVTLLGYFAHEVLEAGNGSEALETLRNRHIDLIIADVLMPTLDGYEFVHRLCAKTGFISTPLIFYSAACYEPEARAKAEACGVRHFLTKPADPELILDAVNSALGRETAAVSLSSLSKFNSHMLTPPADPIDPKAVVFVVDDEAALRDSVSRIVREARLQVQAFATAEEFLDQYKPTQPGCLVLDLRLPGMSGSALLETLRSRRIHIPVIILTGHGDTASVVDAMRLGVKDFLEKPANGRILLGKIYRVLQEDSIKRRIHAHSEAIKQRMATLTLREHDMLKLIILGRSSKEIAAELHISVKTVSHHREHVMAKTRASNSADLVRMSMIALDQ